MSRDKITCADNGDERIPASHDDWQAWVSATKTRNFVERDPLLDWLDLYGTEKGFPRDADLDTYDPRTDFVEFLFTKAEQFENAVIEHLGTMAQVVRVAESAADIRSLEKAIETFEAMGAGVEIVAQAVLRNPEDRTYGAADLLVRSDVLRRLFPDSLSNEAASVGAPELGASSWHYRAVDVKFTTLDIDRYGHETKGHLAYMVQLFVYSEALGRLQGYVPPESYLLGRGWRTSQERGRSFMDRLSRVEHWERYPLRDLAAGAIAWIQRLRTEGGDWSPLPEPSVPELRPNMKNMYNRPWHAAKGQIAEEQGELTLLWNVGVDLRNSANDRGLMRWTDPGCSATAVGLTGPKRAPVLDHLIRVNQAKDGPPVQRGTPSPPDAPWRQPGPVEFYVDFETVNNLNDDFSRIPEIGGQELIFLIGCGHFEGGEWNYQWLVVDRLDEPSEAATIDAWFEHMDIVSRRLASSNYDPYVFHWSPAETSTLENAYRSATARHPERNWPSPNWLDFLHEVIRAEPVVVRGAMGFGLKPVANAMQSHGLIKTAWTDGPTDGLGAMVGAWHCDEVARTEACRLEEVSLMQEIVRYNEVDCRVMAEVVAFLRSHT